MRGYQLASNAPVVRGVPLNALSVPRDEPRHGTEDGPALLKQVLLDLRSVSLKDCRESGCDLRQHSHVGVCLERANHPIEDALQQSTPHRLSPVGWPDLDSDGEWRRDPTSKAVRLNLFASSCQSQPHACQLGVILSFADGCA